MVAFAKPHLKPHTPDRSAKDSGHRFYSPEISRWLSRDPIGEWGGINVYGFVKNRAVSAWDLLGLLFDWQPSDLTGYSAAEKTVAIQTAKDIKDYVDSVVAGKKGTPLLQEVLKCLESTQDVTIKVKVKDLLTKQGSTLPGPYPTPPEIQVLVSGVAVFPTQTIIHEFLHVLEIVYVKSPEDDPCDCLQNAKVIELLSAMKNITGDITAGGMDAKYIALQAAQYATSVLMGLEETQGYGLTKKDLIKYYKTELDPNE